MPVVDRHIARLDAVLYRAPAADGAAETVLNVEAAFDDHDVWGRLEPAFDRRQFDGREVVRARVPVTTPSGQDEWLDVPLRYDATLGPKDMHRRQIRASEDLGGGRTLNLAALRTWGLAASAEIRSRQGEQDVVHFQGPGENLQAHDVGATDARGVSWVGKVMVTEVAGYRRATTELAPQTRITMGNSAFGARKNYLFDVEVYAPGITERAATMSPLEVGQAIERMGLVVESPFLPGGSQPLRGLGHAGPRGHNLKVGWGIADPSNFFDGGNPHRVPPGDYPVKLKQGDRVLGEFTLTWQG